MNEYLFNVIVEGEEDILKTWSESIYLAIDNIICMSVVDNIISIEEIETKKSWDFDGDINQLRVLRENLGSVYL
jgi:hypothetical protein|tara:strand:+ start:556 stop:777 length:222 start_codon:yes stop_codon:yes gene_type:complete